MRVLSVMVVYRLRLSVQVLSSSLTTQLSHGKCALSVGVEGEAQRLERRRISIPLTGDDPRLRAKLSQGPPRSSLKL